MASQAFTANFEWTVDGPPLNPGLKPYRYFGYTGDLGGGSLRLFVLLDAEEVPIPDSVLTETTLDTQGNVVQAFPFTYSGKLVVKLTGATAPDVVVVVL